MHLNRLYLLNFKNYEEADLVFSEKINCFSGDNGSGKTNLLDAIHYLSLTKSFFNQLDQQNILFGSEFFRLQGEYVMEEGRTETIECLQKRNHRKIFRVSKKEYERMADHIGLLPVVMISPADSDLIYHGSEDRRKFMDAVISQFDKLYLEDLIQYHKALQQRNRLLKHFAESRHFSEAEIEIWDRQMEGLGNHIFEKRKAFVERFIPVFSAHFEWISGGREVVGMTYESDLHHGSMQELFERHRQDDRAAAYTTAGIHKDDLLFTIRDMPLKKFGSQGQQKSFLIAIRLAQFDYTSEIKQFKPLLLFDDIFDKLDDFRVERLLRLVSDEHFGQIFITDTSADRIEGIISRIHQNYRFFSISQGKITGRKDPE
jgi:DNA replication and repair protein RecF